MGRPTGSRELDIEDIYKIVEMSADGESHDRSEIADEANTSKRSVYSYQKGFGFV